MNMKLVQVSDSVFMPEPFLDICEAYSKFPLRSEDVLICTYPKCGTTWTQEMVWQILNWDQRQLASEPLLVR